LKFNVRRYKEGPYGAGWRAPQPQWSAFREGSFGAGRLEIHNSTHASWEWRRTTCVAPEGKNPRNETWQGSLFFIFSNSMLDVGERLRVLVDLHSEWSHPLPAPSRAVSLWLVSCSPCHSLSHNRCAVHKWQLIAASIVYSDRAARFAPTGDKGVNCKSANDVSAQAMVAVDSALFVRDVAICPDRAAGSGPGPRPYPTPNPAPTPAPGGAGAAAGGVAVATALTFLSLGWAGTLAGLLRVGNANHCSPRHRIPLHSRDEGSTCERNASACARRHSSVALAPVQDALDDAASNVCQALFAGIRAAAAGAAGRGSAAPRAPE